MRVLVLLLVLLLAVVAAAVVAVWPLLLPSLVLLLEVQYVRVSFWQVWVRETVLDRLFIAGV